MPGRSRPGGSFSPHGYVWAARVSTIALQAVVPAALGYWADTAWGTKPWLLIVGAALGLVLLMRDVIKLSRPGGPKV